MSQRNPECKYHQKILLLHERGNISVSKVHFLVLAFLVLFAGNSIAQGQRTLCGTASYKERVALPRYSKLLVRVFRDAEDKPLREEVIPTNGKQVPLRFCILAPEGSTPDYHLRISICVKGKEWFSNAPGTPLSNAEKQDLHVLLQKTSNSNTLVCSDTQEK